MNKEIERRLIDVGFQKREVKKLYDLNPPLGEEELYLLENDCLPGRVVWGDGETERIEYRGRNRARRNSR